MRTLQQDLLRLGLATRSRRGGGKGYRRCHCRNERIPCRRLHLHIPIIIVVSKRQDFLWLCAPPSLFAKSWVGRGFGPLRLLGGRRGHFGRVGSDGPSGFRSLLLPFPFGRHRALALFAVIVIRQKRRCKGGILLLTTLSVSAKKKRRTRNTPFSRLTRQAFLLVAG